MNFEVYGPYALDVPPKTDRYNRWRSEICTRINGTNDGVTKAIGCYVVALRNKPIYVGKTIKQTLGKEVFEGHKLDHYRASIDQKQRPGKLELFLIPKVKPTKNSFVGPPKKGSSTKHADIDYLEKLLIGMALSRNPDVRNSRDTAIHKNLKVEGLVKPSRGPRSNDSKKLRSVFGLSDEPKI